MNKETFISQSAARRLSTSSPTQLPRQPVSGAFYVGKQYVSQKCERNRCDSPGSNLLMNGGHAYHRNYQKCLPSGDNSHDLKIDKGSFNTFKQSSRLLQISPTPEYNTCLTFQDGRRSLPNVSLGNKKAVIVQSKEEEMIMDGSYQRYSSTMSIDSSDGSFHQKEEEYTTTCTIEDTPFNDYRGRSSSIPHHLSSTSDPHERLHSSSCLSSKISRNLTEQKQMTITRAERAACASPITANYIMSNENYKEESISIAKAYKKAIGEAGTNEETVITRSERKTTMLLKSSQHRDVNNSKATEKKEAQPADQLSKQQTWKRCNSPDFMMQPRADNFNQASAFTRRDGKNTDIGVLPGKITLILNRAPSPDMSNLKRSGPDGSLNKTTQILNRAPSPDMSNLKRSCPVGTRDFKQDSQTLFQQKKAIQERSRSSVMEKTNASSNNINSFEKIPETRKQQLALSSKVSQEVTGKSLAFKNESMSGETKNNALLNSDAVVANIRMQYGGRSLAIKKKPKTAKDAGDEFNHGNHQSSKTTPSLFKKSSTMKQTPEDNITFSIGAAPLQKTFTKSQKSGLATYTNYEKMNLSAQNYSINQLEKRTLQSQSVTKPIVAATNSKTFHEQNKPLEQASKEITSEVTKNNKNSDQTRSLFAKSSRKPSEERTSPQPNIRYSNLSTKIVEVRELPSMDSKLGTASPWPMKPTSQGASHANIEVDTSSCSQVKLQVAELTKKVTNTEPGKQMLRHGKARRMKLVARRKAYSENLQPNIQIHEIIHNQGKNNGQADKIGDEVFKAGLLNETENDENICIESQTQVSVSKVKTVCQSLEPKQQKKPYMREIEDDIVKSSKNVVANEIIEAKSRKIEPLQKQPILNETSDLTPGSPKGRVQKLYDNACFPKENIFDQSWNKDAEQVRASCTDVACKSPVYREGRQNAVRAAVLGIEKTTVLVSERPVTELIAGLKSPRRDISNQDGNHDSRYEIQTQALANKAKDEVLSRFSSTVHAQDNDQIITRAERKSVVKAIVQASNQQAAILAQDSLYRKSVIHHRNKVRQQHQPQRQKEQAENFMEVAKRTLSEDTTGGTTWSDSWPEPVVQQTSESNEENLKDVANRVEEKSTIPHSMTTQNLQLTSWKNKFLGNNVMKVNSKILNTSENINPSRTESQVRAIDRKDNITEQNQPSRVSLIKKLFGGGKRKDNA